MLHAANNLGSIDMGSTLLPMPSTLLTPTQGYRYSAGSICDPPQPHDPMDALKKALETPAVRVPLTWGVCCASAASLHAYASLFAAVPRPKTRVLRSLDVGFVIFAISSTLAYYNQPRPDE